jgi:hypothetical protein
MKKVKLMLLSLSILAVVGGALAFTARSGITYCTAPTVNELNQCNTTCPDPAKLNVTGEVWICTTPTSLDAAHPCERDGAALPCNTSIQAVKE